MQGARVPLKSPATLLTKTSRVSPLPRSEDYDVHPQSFAVEDRKTLLAFVDAYAFATLISHGEEPEVTHLPLLLDAKIAAVWEWADTTGRGDLGPAQLQRLAGRVMAGDTLDLQFEELCNVLGLDPLSLLVQTEDVRIDAARFAAACRDKPERTVNGEAGPHLSGWFEKLALALSL